MSRRKIQRFDVPTLEAARELFMTLAGREKRGEVRDALRLAAVITSTLLIPVAAMYELRVFLHDTIGRRR